MLLVLQLAGNVDTTEPLFYDPKLVILTSKDIPPVNEQVNPLSSAGFFCGQINQSIIYVDSCLELANLIKMSTNKSTLVRSQWFLYFLPNQAWAASSAA